MEEYVVLSPVGHYRTKYLEDFLEALKVLAPPPAEIVLCFDLDSEFDYKKLQGVTIKLSPSMGRRGSLERICEAREILRNHFISGPYNQALWVDSDIIIPPETPRVLYDVMEDKKVWVVVNKYQGRGEELWCGSGLMLTHRQACTASRFWVGIIMDRDGNEKHLSEDFVFFAIFDQGRFLLDLWTGRSGRVCSEFVKVEHRLK